MEGDSETYEAGDAGTVEVKRVSQTEFSIGEVTPDAGWTYEITAPTAPRAKVKFTNSDGPPWIVRFAASMDQKGEEIHIRVTTCQ
jgi:hypothetical protein